ncbi:MAG: YmdB family metallophosphoesterase [Opitutales bacterium]
MRLLFIGDIVGSPGREIVAKRLPALRKELGLDLVIANAENSAAGAGMSAKIAPELEKAGVDAITLGDHVWDVKGFASEIDALERVCRPANLSPRSPGKRFLIVEAPDGFRLGVATVLGRTFMKVPADDPFRSAEELLEELRPLCDGLFLEVHAEATSEKIAMGWYLDGRALAVCGTHTHVPTADARVLPRGTAYHTDAGMTGPYESVLGREIQPILAKLLDGLPRRWPVAAGDVRLCGTLIDFDPEAGIATRCEPFAIGGDADVEPEPEESAVEADPAEIG